MAVRTASDRGDWRAQCAANHSPSKVRARVGALSISPLKESKPNTMAVGACGSHVSGHRVGLLGWRRAGEAAGDADGAFPASIGALWAEIRHQRAGNCEERQEILAPSWRR